MILIDTQKEEFERLKELRIFEKENPDVFNGNILFVGLGGLGTSVIRSLKAMMRYHISKEDNIHFLSIDSCISDMESSLMDQANGRALSNPEIISIYRENLHDILINGTGQGMVQDSLAKWMGKDFPKINIGPEGAKGNRQIGRLMFSNAYEDIRFLLFEKLEEYYADSDSRGLDIFFVTGLGGGTGSGILADVAYNVRAYAKMKKWDNVRLGGFLLTPDTLYGNENVYDNKELCTLMNANSYAAMSEIEELMTNVENDRAYVFESGVHRLSIKADIFDSCMVITGRKESDDRFVPVKTLCSDAAYILLKLSKVKYIGNGSISKGTKRMLRDAFFSDSQGTFKIINELDYKIPVKEIENICEYQVFNAAYRDIHGVPDDKRLLQNSDETFGRLREFLNSGTEDEIYLPIKGLLRISMYEKPDYKSIKKGFDDFRGRALRDYQSFERNIDTAIKEYKDQVINTMKKHINEYLRDYGPFVTVAIIGSAGFADNDKDTGMIKVLKDMNDKLNEEHNSQDYGRIIESIVDMTSRRFFTFPGAKRETENGYYDASVKNILQKERRLIRNELHDQDFFGDIIRKLRRRSERIMDIYSQFDEDLRNEVSYLNEVGKKMVSFLLKDARRYEYLPTDYIDAERIEYFRIGLIRIMLDHEVDIDNGRIVPIKDELEKLYTDFFRGIGTYPGEKVIYTAFADERPNVAETNMMFASPTNERRAEVMNRAANAFVKATGTKVSNKQVCLLNEKGMKDAIRKRYISLPEAMPYFSDAVKKILMKAPYNYESGVITLNAGAYEISVEDIFTGVSKDMFWTSNEMAKDYGMVSQSDYKGLHIEG